MEGACEGGLRGATAGLCPQLRDSCKLSFHIAATKKLLASTNCSALSGASLRYIKTSSGSGSKLNVSSKVKYQHFVDSYVVSVDVVGATEEVQRAESPRRQGLAEKMCRDRGPVRDKVCRGVHVVVCRLRQCQQRHTWASVVVKNLSDQVQRICRHV